MKNLFQKSGWSSLLSSILFLLLGILLVSNPQELIAFISYIIGGVFIVIGIFKIISYFIDKNRYMYYYKSNLTIGIICIIIGLIITIFGNMLVSLFGFVIGLWILINGINRIDMSMKMKNSNINYWIISLIFSVLIIISGVYIIFVPGTLLVTIRSCINYIFDNGHH